MRGFVPQAKVPETLAPIVGVKKNLQIIKDYHQGKIKLPLHEVLAIVNEAIIYADLIN
jgi:hypothetical protein